MNIKELYEDAELFEAENVVMMHDIDFWRKIIHINRPKSVLELGCGTGRIARFIMDDIDQYTGIDISDTFISFFKGTNCYKNNEEKINLVTDDVLNLRTTKRFDLIMVTSQFPGHIYKFHDFLALLRNLVSMLTDNGKIVIDYCNPDLRFLENHKEYQYCYEFPYRGLVRVYEKNIYNQVEQINYEYRKYVMPDGKDICQTIPFRIYFPQEMDALISLSNLCIDSKYGDYDFSNYEEYCNKQLYILCKANMNDE